jgi:hypothetical protein
MGNTTHEGAEGIKNFLKKLPNHESLHFDDVMADSGGGFVREPKKAALQAKGFCHSSSLIANCTCHNIQLTGTVPMKHLFQKARFRWHSELTPNALPHLQISVYTMEKARELLGTLNDEYEMELDEDELTEWQANKKKLLVTKPDNLRWLYTACAIDQIKNNYDNWMKLATGFFRSYFFQHFKFLQGVNPNIGKPGFLSYHIFVQVFLMHEDLDCLLRYKTEKHDEMEAKV